MEDYSYLCNKQQDKDGKTDYYGDCLDADLDGVGTDK